MWAHFSADANGRLVPSQNAVNEIECHCRIGRVWIKHPNQAVIIERKP